MGMYNMNQDKRDPIEWAEEKSFGEVFEEPDYDD